MEAGIYRLDDPKGPRFFKVYKVNGQFSAIEVDSLGTTIQDDYPVTEQVLSRLTPVGFSMSGEYKREDYLQKIIDEAHEFSVTQFQGSGKWETLRGFRTLFEARTVAEHLATDPGRTNKRGYMIYAIAWVSGSPHSAHVENVG